MAMNRPVLLAAVLSLFSFSISGWSDDNPFYLEAGLGHASVDRGVPAANQAQGGGINGTITSKTLVGGYIITPNLAIEFGYHDFGNPTSFNINNIAVPCHAIGQPPFSCIDTTCPDAANQFPCPRISGFSGEIVGRYAWNEQLTLEILGGLMRWSGGYPTKVLLNEDSGGVALAGLRASYMWNDSLGFDITYEYSSFTTEETAVALRYVF